MKEPKIKNILLLTLILGWSFMSEAKNSGQIPVSFTTAKGIAVDILEKHDIKNVTFSLKFWGAGSYSDPGDKEGLSSFTGRLVGRGPEGLSYKDYKDKIDFLGSSLGVGSSLAYFSFGGESLTENLEKTLEIARDLVLKPRFSKEDFEVVKHSVLGSKKAQKDNDQFLVYAFTRANFYPESHPYGKLSRGSTKSIESIKLEEVQAFYKKFVVKENLRVQFTGDIDQKTAEKLVDRLFSGVPSGKKVDFKIEGTKTENKLRVLFVDKPKRTQCQLLFSLRTMPFSHEDYPAFYLFNQAFGGGFTSRLMTEVRVKRGWSYGAYSSIYDRFSGDYYVAYTFPALKDTLPAIKLVREMFAKVHKDGITKEEFEFARDMAINKHPFGFDVPEKSMGKLNEEIELDLKRGFFFNFPEKLKLLTLESVNKAAKKWLPNDNFMLTIVAPKEELLEEVKKLFPKAEVKVVNFQDI